MIRIIEIKDYIDCSKRQLSSSRIAADRSVSFVGHVPIANFLLLQQILAQSIVERGNKVNDETNLI